MSLIKWFKKKSRKQESTSEPLKTKPKKPANKRAKRINPIRKRILKRELKKGNDAKNSMLKAGYKPNTAHNATQTNIVKTCQEEISQELKAKDITVDYLIGLLLQAKELCLTGNKADITNFIRSIDSMARIVSIGSQDKTVINIANVPNTSEELTQSILDRLKR